MKYINLTDEEGSVIINIEDIIYVSSGNFYNDLKSKLSLRGGMDFYVYQTVSDIKRELDKHIF